MPSEGEPSNSVDPYAVAVIKRLEFIESGHTSSSSFAASSNTVVGHVALSSLQYFLAKEL